MSVQVHLIRVRDEDYKKLSEIAENESRSIPNQIKKMIDDTYTNKQ